MSAVSLENLTTKQLRAKLVNMEALVAADPGPTLGREAAARLLVLRAEILRREHRALLFLGHVARKAHALSLGLSLRLRLFTRRPHGGGLLWQGIADD